MRVTRSVACLLCLAVGAIAGNAERLPARKKLIEYGWDVPTPAQVAASLATMERRPFDGVIMRLAGKGGGQVFSGGRWNEADFAADMAALTSIRWGTFTDNFIMVYAASEMDWFSDADWEAVVHNLEIMARAAKAGRCSLAFDAEPYGKNPWLYPEQAQAKGRSFAEYQAMVRRRGAQFVTALQKHLPDTVLVTLFTYAVVGDVLALPEPARRQEALAQHGYGLYVPFLAGIMDAMGPGLTLTDGNEPSYYYTSSEAYYAAYHLMRQGALGLVPPENVGKFLSQTQASQALYFDYVFARVPWKGIPALYMTDAERLTWWEHNVYWALRTADEYVWLYSEKMNWWTDEGLPQGMEQAIVSAREKIAAGKPLGFDLREMMATVEQRREAEVAATLIRRAAAIPALGAVPAPGIDGDLGDAAWTAAAALEPFVGIFGTAPDELKAATRAYLTYDRTSLYIALRCDEPEPGKMHVVGAQHDDGVWGGDSIDILLSAAASGKPYVHFILNPRNVRWDAAYATDNDMGYDPAWQSATRIGTSEWTVEVAIPWAALQISPEAGLELRANLCRNRHWANELSSWSQVLRGFMEQAHFGTWTLQ